MQGHTPVLSPVRAFTLSNAYDADFEKFNFWKVLRKHKVDLYFAGEVHRTTVIRDSTPDLIQVAHHGFPNAVFLVERVYDSSIQLEYYKFILLGSGKIGYPKTSTLTIYKSQPIPKLSLVGKLRQKIFSKFQLNQTITNSVFGSLIDANLIQIKFNTS